ncbi:hypothetical protein LSM04_000442 [Trypanosoma melophagium]|uniref:uncharacterized protein n=1 Tax=Trypanosoma melophagium TaxID=715481 RepID=UPI00351A14C2|nr:hypothetical protein LSM04_000442 [Trypanosoma melophagium]
MKFGEASAEFYYRSFLNHCFYDVEELNINNLTNTSPSSILTYSPRLSLLERCDVIRSQTRSFLKVLQIIVVHITASTPVAELVHDVKGEVYCSLHLYDVSESDDPNLPVSRGLLDDRHFTIALPEYTTELKMIAIENLLFFCQAGNASGIVLLLDKIVVNSSPENLTPYPILGTFPFLSFSGYYDDSNYSALLSFLDTHKLFSVTIPVDIHRRKEDISTTRVLYLSVPRGSLHFHVCCVLIIVCP